MARTGELAPCAAGLESPWTVAPKTEVQLQGKEAYRQRQERYEVSGTRALWSLMSDAHGKGRPVGGLRCHLCWGRTEWPMSPVPVLVSSARFRLAAPASPMAQRAVRLVALRWKGQ